MVNKNKAACCLLCMGLALSVLCACGRRSGMESKAQSNDVIKGESSVPYFDRDEKAIKKYLASYPNDNEALKQSDILCVCLGYASGHEYWERFLEKVEKKEKCSIVIVTFTRMNEPEISYVEYNGTDFYHMRDSSRVPECKKWDIEYQSWVYSNLKCIEMSQDDYDIDFSKLNGPVIGVCFTNKKIRSYEEFKKKCVNTSSPVEYFNFTLWPWTKDVYLNAVAEGVLDD